MDLGLLTPMTVSLLLHFVRVGAFFAVVPIFGRNTDSTVLRLVLAISLAAMLWWIGDMTVTPPANMLALGVMALRESLIGFALGFAFAAMMAMLTMAGEVVSMEMGFSMAQAINPETGANSSVVSQLFTVFGTLMIFELDLHHDVLLTVRQTFVACPVGEPFAFEPLWQGVQTLVSGSIHLALKFSMPVIGIMLLVSSGTVLIGRAVPSINMMEFAFGLRILMALGILAVYLVEGMPFIVASFEGMIDFTMETFGG